MMMMFVLYCNVIHFHIVLCWFTYVYNYEQISPLVLFHSHKPKFQFKLDALYKTHFSKKNNATDFLLIKKKC